MMRVKARRQPEEAEIIIIPMIDTMMFLLMFFIVASLAMVVQQSIRVSLPKAATAERHPALNITVTIAADGDLHLNTRPITLTDETNALQGLGVSATTLIIINADQRVPHGIVIAAMDNARKAGVEQFAFATSS